MDQNNNGYIPQGGQQVPQQGYNYGAQQAPQQGYNYGAQQVPQQGYNYGAQQAPQQGYNPQQVPQQGYNYGAQQVPQQGQKNSKTTNIVLGVLGALFVIGLLVSFLSSSSLDSKITGTWVKGSETMVFKSNHTFEVTQDGSTVASGKWETNSDKELTLTVTEYGLSVPVKMTWCEPGQNPSSVFYWYVTDSEFCISGDTYTKG